MVRAAHFVALAVAVLAAQAVAVPAKSRGPLPSTSPSPAKPRTAFEDAGKKAGLEIWRVHNFTAIPYPKENYGDFYYGETFVVLQTHENRGTLSWDIFFWLGQDASQLDALAASFLCVELSDLLGDSEAYRRGERQYIESKQFLEIFQGGLHYVPGNFTRSPHDNTARLQ